MTTSTSARPEHWPASEISLRLASIDHLWVAPDISPLDPRWHEQSGVAYLATLWKHTRSPGPLHLTLWLPAEALFPGLETQAEAVLQRYCSDRIRENESEILMIRGRAYRGLLLGLVVLAFFLALVQLMPYVSLLPSWLESVLNESLVIAGWVAFWHPFEAWLYEWRPNQLAINFYRHLSAATITIQPDPHGSDIQPKRG